MGMAHISVYREKTKYNYTLSSINSFVYCYTPGIPASKVLQSGGEEQTAVWNTVVHSTKYEMHWKRLRFSVLFTPRRTRYYSSRLSYFFISGNLLSLPSLHHSFAHLLPLSNWHSTASATARACTQSCIYYKQHDVLRILCVWRYWVARLLEYSLRCLVRRLCLPFSHYTIRRRYATIYSCTLQTIRT